MRQGSLFLLMILSFAMPVVHAEQGTTDPTTDRQTEPEQPLPENGLQREDLNSRLDTAITDAEWAQLRRENQRLRMQLQQGRPKAQPQLLNDQQQWFAVGGVVGVLGFLLGVLTTRGRRRRQWLN